MNCLNISTIWTVYCYLLRIVDVVDDKITLGTCYHSDIVTHTGRTRLQITKHTVAKHQTDGICQVHTRIRLHALALHADDIGRKEHPHEVERIDTEIEQGPATEVRPHDTRLLAHRVAEGCRQQPRDTDTTIFHELTHHFHNRLIACPDSLCQEYFPIVGQVNNLFCLPIVSHKRLLHKAWFTRQQSLFRHIEMMRVRSTHINQVHVGVVDQLSI